MKKEKRYHFRDILAALVYFFRQATGLLSIPFKNANRATYGGNLDPTYLLGASYSKDVIKNKKRRNEFFAFILPFLIIAIFHILFINTLDLPKYAITFAKLVLCILTMLFVKNYTKKINLYHFSLFYTLFAIVGTVLSFIFQNTITWRYNDYINSFDLTRLQLFYLEPSELGFHASIIILILFYLLLTDKIKKYKWKIIIAILANIFILYLSKALGAIVILSVVILLLGLYSTILRPTKNNVSRFIVFIITAIALVIVSINSNSSIAERISSVVSGTDGSVNYRVNVSFNVLGQSMNDSGFLGVGLGNVNTQEFISKYYDIGLDQMIVNSFVYFWVETGIIGFIIWVIFMGMLFKKTLSKKDRLAFALLCFIFLYQFVGSHYTSGLNWIIYGYILSNRRLEDEE